MRTAGGGSLHEHEQRSQDAVVGLSSSLPATHEGLRFMPVPCKSMAISPALRRAEGKEKQKFKVIFHATVSLRPSQPGRHMRPCPLK